MNLSEKINQVKNSVVAIGVLDRENNRVNIMGSGFCVGDSGRILTAAHVIKEIPPEQQENLACLAMEQKGKIEKYKWLNIDIQEEIPENDMAIVKAKNYSSTLLAPLKIMEADKVEEIVEGQDVYFIGFPYAAQLMNDGFGVSLIANRGMISSVKRKGIESNPLDWFIIDAISNPGNSGCPLIDVETNMAIGLMSISFKTRSRIQPELDIREPMHIAGAKPINLLKNF